MKMIKGRGCFRDNIKILVLRIMADIVLFDF